METGSDARQAAGRSHSLHLDNRRQAALTGIDEVIAFDDTQVILGTGQGEIVLTGEGLLVKNLSLDEGNLTVDGRIDGILYSQRRKRRGLLRRRET